MDFYNATYKKQRKDLESEVWKDTSYINQEIIVIADSLEEAENKINYCLNKMKYDYPTYSIRMVLVDSISKCVGIAMEHGFEDSFYCNPIN